jgi:hypothetical protein
MPIQTDTINRGLYDLLTVRYDDVTPLDSEEKTTAPEEADIFRFTFEKDGQSYGKVYVTIDNSRNLVLYYGDEVEDSPDTNTSGTEFTDSWSGFRNMLKQWSQRKQLDFELKNKNHLAKDMAQRTYYKDKENLGESYYPMGKRGSYSDAVPNVKIIIQHTRQIGEGEQRYRNIDKIFVENTMGERFAVPSNKPGIAKVYARHIAEGGSPYDDRGRHITSLVEEYTKMAGFVRATKNKQFNESTTMLIQEGVNHYQALRETLGRMIGRRGYNAYFESWQPVLSEEITEEAGLNELFVQETIDPRIESVMPILSKLYKKASEMKEINQLESWANKIIEETTDLKTIPEAELDEGKGAIRKFLAGLGIAIGLGTYISSEDEAILQQMAVEYDQAQTPQEKAQIKHDIERVTKGSLVKEEGVAEAINEADYPGQLDTSKLILKSIRHAGGDSHPGSPGYFGGPVYDNLGQYIGNLGFFPGGKLSSGNYSWPSKAVLSVKNPRDPHLRDYWEKMGKDNIGYEYFPLDYRITDSNDPLMKQAISQVEKLKQGVAEGMPTSSLTSRYMDDPTHPSYKSTTSPKKEKTLQDILKDSDFAALQIWAHNNPNNSLVKGASAAGDAAANNIKKQLGLAGKMSYEIPAGVMMNKIHPVTTKAMFDYLRTHVKPGMAEDLDANQKRVGQLGPYEKVGPQGAVGKLVGGESIREGQEDLDTIRRLLGK